VDAAAVALMVSSSQQSRAQTAGGQLMTASAQVWELPSMTDYD